MRKVLSYLKWVALILLIICAYGLVRQNHINRENVQHAMAVDTTDVDTLPKLMTPQELTELLRSRTKPDNRIATKNQIPYRDLFELYAPEIGWQWELLAAVCYSESKFNPSARSRSGAQGLMQLMPKVTTKLEVENPYDPEQNIAASVKYIRSLINLYSFIGNRKERTKFILASYNAGPAHIMDARRLAKKHDANPNVWYENTEYWLYCLRDSTIASDTVVKAGCFRPMQTLLYVHKVLRYYDKFLSLPEGEPDDPEIPDIPPTDSLQKDTLVERLIEELKIETDTTE